MLLLCSFIPIVDDECLEAAGGLRLNPVFEDEPQDATGHLRVVCDEDAFNARKAMIIA